MAKLTKIPQKDLKEKIMNLEKFIERRQKLRENIIRFPSKNEEDGDTMPPDVVIAEAFGQLSEVIIGGIDKKGRWWFSCSEQDNAKVLWILENFKTALIDSAPERDFNLGREI